ncbi:hypothetical protein ACFWBR_42440 [Streptomyces sp. NPDC060006]|uniref:hypothetical protein n=1 Tax=unclassified Streptomyces TaxID=2593676 RepID=UPI0036C59018
MTYNMAPPHGPWFEHLIDSVRALGEAAREWQLADQTARLLEAGVQMERRTLFEGKILVHSPAARGWDAKPRDREPHARAVMDLQKIYMEHQFVTRRHYEHAALLFASGAARAITQVQAGEQPERVLFPLDKDRHPVVGGYKIGDLGNYVHAKKIAAAYEQLARMDMAAEAAEDLAGRDYVADHEASEMFEASQYALGLPDAAYAYGLLGEGALRFVLLGPIAAHREELAKRRAAEQQAAAADEQGGAQ